MPETTVGEFLDGVPVGRFHRQLLLLVGSVWALGAMEVLLISFILPVLLNTWELTGLEAGLLGSAILIGMVVGSWIGGMASDRVGRVATLQIAVASYAIATGGSAFASGFESLFWLRLLTGIGVGATATSATTYLSEHLPTSKRGSYLVYLDGFWALGTIIAVVVAWLVLVVIHDIGRSIGLAPWRVLFLIAAFPIVLVPVVRLKLAETPYYLLATGQVQAARARLAAITSQADLDAELVVAKPHANGDPTDPEWGLGHLFTVDLRRRTAVISIAWFGINLGYYGVFIWLPETIGAAGLVGSIYRYLFLVAVVQLPGYLSAAWLIDRVGRKWTVGSYLVCSGAATIVFAAALPVAGRTLGPIGSLPFVGGLLASSFFALGAFGSLRAYSPEAFPTPLRSTGTGFAEGTGRIAGILGPILAGALASAGYFVALAPLAIAFLVAGAVVLTLGPETRGRTLV